MGTLAEAEEVALFGGSSVVPQSKLNRSFPDDIVSRTTDETFQLLSPSNEITQGVPLGWDAVMMCQSAVAE